MGLDEHFADRVRAALGGRQDVVEKKMFGGLCFMVNGHMCCGLTATDFMVRVGPEQYEVALADPNARPMDFTGRPLVGMVYVAPSGTRTRAALAKWVKRGVDFASKLPAKGTKESAAGARDGRAKRPSGSADLRSLLAGGDRRSIAGSKRARSLVIANPERVRELVVLTADKDWLVSMRALDLLEKLAHDHPSWVSPHRRVFIGSLADSDKWEHRLQVVRALPLFVWKGRNYERVVQILSRDAEHPQKFVRAWALDSLATLAQRDAKLMPRVKRLLGEFERSGSKALATRARHIRARIA